MSKMKHTLGLLTTFSLMSVNHLQGQFYDEPKAEKLKEENRKRIIKLNGMKEFAYGDKIVLALNQKNADRKAKKLKYI